MCRQGKKKALRSFRVGTRVLFLIAVSSLCLAACAPTFSPPVRTAILGVPGRQAPNEIMAGLSVVGVSPAVGAMLTPYFSVPVTGNLFVEAGASTSKFFTMGYLGGKISKRLRPANSGWGQDGLFGTLSFGGGVGRGGERHRQATVADPYRYLSETVVKPFESLAGGLYLDAGLGYFPLSWFGLGLGARLQGTKAQNIPATLWHQYLASVELFVDIFSVYVSSGLAFYYNREDWNSGLVMEGGLTARLPFGDSLRAPTEWKKNLFDRRWIRPHSSGFFLCLLSGCNENCAKGLGPATVQGQGRTASGSKRNDPNQGAAFAVVWKSQMDLDAGWGIPIFQRRGNVIYTGQGAGDLSGI